MRMTVMIDLDDVVWDFVGNLIEKYNMKYDDSIEKSDINDWKISKFLKPECENIFKEFVCEDFFKELTIDGDIKTCLTLIDDYADLYFVTAGHSKTIPYRAKALKGQLKWFRDVQLVKLTDKSKFYCDYSVDDNIDNCFNSKGQAYLVTQPWNKNIDVSETEIIRANSTVDALNKVLIEICKNGATMKERTMKND